MTAHLCRHPFTQRLTDLARATLLHPKQVAGNRTHDNITNLVGKVFAFLLLLKDGKLKAVDKDRMTHYRQTWVCPLPRPEL